jgi:hypothetical protein
MVVVKDKEALANDSFKELRDWLRYVAPSASLPFTTIFIFHIRLI